MSAGCRAAIAGGSAAPLDARVGLLLDACQVCGPWKPILEWRTLQTAGGPTRAEIEKAMLGCNAYCDPNAKERFLGTLDDSRGQRSRGPWRHLAELCKGAVSAVPDGRYASATLFALDRVARAVGSAGGSDAAALAALDVPLPALSLSGVGVELPRSAAAVASAPRTHVTIIGDELHVGLLPRARLTANGVVTDSGREAYPGAATVDPNAELGALGSAGSPGEIVLVAPAQLPAARVAAVVGMLHVPRILLAVAVDAPDSWQLIGTMSVALSAGNGSDGSGGEAVAPTGTVQDLVDALAKLAARGVTQASLSAAP